MTDGLAGFNPCHDGSVAMTPPLLALSFFVAALMTSIVSSAWMRPDVPLGWPYWILTLVLTAPALLVPLLSLVEPLAFWPIVAVLLLFGPIAVGWLTGTVIAILVRAVRARVGATLES